MKYASHAFLAVLLLSRVSFAQTVNGEALFAKTCATGYCHASKGVGGGAPRLAARGLSPEFIRDRVTNGVTGTGMAGFKATMTPRELNAVIGYVAALNGTLPDTGVRPTRRTFTGIAEQGRVLFSEATRGFTRCSTCHQANGLGIGVTPPLDRIPATVDVFKNLATPSVSTAKVGGESMPALLLARRAQEVIFYDLTSAPPVLRTLPPESVTITDGSSWRHTAVLGNYSDAELTAILSFLRGL